MTKIYLLIFSMFILPFVSLKAQLGFSEWERSYFANNATIEQREFVRKIRFPDFIQIPKLKIAEYGWDEKISWDICLKRSFAAFFTEPRSYGYSKAVAVAYGLFNLGNYKAFRYQPLLKQHFNDTAFVEDMFNNLLPILKESWRLLDSSTKKIYSSLIVHNELYLKSFDYEKESNYYQLLSSTSQAEQFLISGYQNKSENEFRKAEAFIFRRIHDSKKGKGNWTLSWIKKMNKKLKFNLLL